MDYHIIIQARINSSRFKNKIFKKLNGKPVLDFLINRLLKYYTKDTIIIATSNKKTDTKISKYAKKKGIAVFRGSENDVLDRYVRCSKKYNVKNIVRLTSDCPLIDISLIFKMWKIYKKKKLDYISNTLPPNESTFPDGSDIEIISFKKLNLINKKKLNKTDKEHVTNIFWQSKKFKYFNFKNKRNISKYKYSLDYKTDFDLIVEIVNNIGHAEKNYNPNKIVNFINKNKRLNKLSKNSKKMFIQNRKDIYEN